MTTTIREGFATITPYIMLADVEPLVAFAKQVVGAVETERATGSAGGTHVELRIGDAMLMLGGGAPVKGREMHAALHVYVPDVDAAYQRAMDAGGESLGAPDDKPYGERAAFVKDPFGNAWFIATRQGPDYTHVGMRAVTAYLHCPDAMKVIEFLKRALGAEEDAIYRTPEGKLMHAVARIGDSALEFGESTDTLLGTASAYYLYVADPDALYKQALEAGAKSVYPPADQPYGERMAGVEDPWGNHWFLARQLSAAIR